MNVTEKDVAYVAVLSNLELTAEERERMVRDLNAILGHIDTLEKLDTANVEPMAQVSDRYGVDQSKQGSERFAYASREDILEGLRKSLPHNEALANAPDSDGIFFRVPKVIER
ncbi:MAG: Asp-tRNA(Asn)/Glu-tRNA(Gln) amidotransferase subunit GatC [Terriglobales bacterium]|jgi:aspartyl-tRNA(Asn)/glutamyl-tRNA(Gln) amidotransferase subunit C|nr:Asp-tRNA(Asn)/Glu-tRNA(Gln) amidotransferase subunit GatC [Terriglobales bacterium]